MALIKNGKTYRTIEEQVGYLSEKQNEQDEINQTLESDVNELSEAVAGKQDTLTFDTQPIDGSTNPVESNGIYDALAGKLDKKTNTTTNQQAYVKAQDGTQTMVDTSTGNGANTIAKRYTNGRLSVGTPSDSNDATTKLYVDSAVGDKLNKVTSVTTTAQAYIKTASGTQDVMNINTSYVGNTLVQRTADGIITAANPVNDYDVVNRIYMHTTLQDKQDKLTAGDNINITSNTIKVSSGAATSGKVLTSNGSGSATWEDASGGGLEIIDVGTSSGGIFTQSQFDKILSGTAIVKRSNDYYYLQYKLGTTNVRLVSIYTDYSNKYITGKCITITYANRNWTTNNVDVYQKITKNYIDSETTTSGKVLTANGSGGATWETPSGGSPKYHHRINGYVMLNVEGSDYPFAVSIDFYNNVSTAYTSIADVISALITAGYTWDVNTEKPIKICNGYLWNKGSAFSDLMAFVNLSALNYGGTNYIIAYDVHETSNDVGLFAAGTQTASNFLTDDVIALVG